MSDFLIHWYPWVKTLHVIAVIAWMAGLFYLPRLYVYHAEKALPGGEADGLFLVMESRLLRAILAPAMIATWVFGLMLVFTPGAIDWAAHWPWVKAGAVLAMTWFHHWLAKRRKDFAGGVNRFSGRTYRLMNEVPTVLLVLIIAAVIVKF